MVGSITPEANVVITFSLPLQQLPPELTVAAQQGYPGHDAAP